LVSTIIVFPISLSSCDVPGFFTMAGTRYGIMWCESFCRNSRKLVKPNARTIRCTDVPKLRPPIWWLSTTKFTINCEQNAKWQYEPQIVHNTNLTMCKTWTSQCAQYKPHNVCNTNLTVCTIQTSQFVQYKPHSVHNTNLTICITLISQCAQHEPHNVHNTNLTMILTMCTTQTSQCVQYKPHNVCNTNLTVCTIQTSQYE
jgi:hypothetical protein